MSGLALSSEEPGGELPVPMGCGSTAAFYESGAPASMDNGARRMV